MAVSDQQSFVTGAWILLSAGAVLVRPVVPIPQNGSRLMCCIDAVAQNAANWLRCLPSMRSLFQLAHRQPCLSIGATVVRVEVGTGY